MVGGGDGSGTAGTAQVALSSNTLQWRPSPRRAAVGRNRWRGEDLTGPKKLFPFLGAVPF